MITSYFLHSHKIKGAFYQPFFWLSTATSLELISSNNDLLSGQHYLDSGKNLQRFESFSFKIKILTLRMMRNLVSLLNFSFI